MMWADVFVFPLAKVFANQAVMLDVICEFKECDSNQRLYQKKPDTSPPTDQGGDCQKPQGPEAVTPEWVGFVPDRTFSCCQSCSFDLP